MEEPIEVIEGMAPEGTEDICAYVRKLRSVLGLNQTEFARRWDVSIATVSRIESGERMNIGYDLVRKLVANFGVSPRVLFPPKNGENAKADEA